ncbi:hypothetical protein BDR26DRAFT_869056 [Obelidium mucronatum]|nr:hypothetical protein BDR26DRAFT_869056 [Obelidium mucronatum]
MLQSSASSSSVSTKDTQPASTIGTTPTTAPTEFRQRQHLPIGVCLKNPNLRRRGYNNLQEWANTPGNVLVIRAGRVRYKDPNTGELKTFGYKASPWANPYKLSEFPIDVSLANFRVHLRNQVERDPEVLREFLKLADAKEIGCFCMEGDKCHRNEILKLLKEKCDGEAQAVDEF